MLSLISSLRGGWGRLKKGLNMRSAVHDHHGFLCLAIKWVQDRLNVHHLAASVAGDEDDIAKTIIELSRNYQGCVRDSHPAAPGSNPGCASFSQLFSSCTKERLSPSSAYACDFAIAVSCKGQSTTKAGLANDDRGSECSQNIKLF